MVPGGAVEGMTGMARGSVAGPSRTAPASKIPGSKNRRLTPLKYLFKGNTKYKK
jgi:hypothetical protein